MKTINQINSFQNSENEIGQNFSNVSIQNQYNIFNSYTKYRPIKWLKEIKIKEQKSSHQDKKALKIGFIICAVILSLLVSSNFTDILFNTIFSFLIFTIFFYFSFHIFLLVPYLISSNGTLKLNDNEIIFNFGKGKEESIKFNEIRSLRKEKNLFGYSFYIYKDVELYPSVNFYIESIDVSLTIDELLSFKIKESINKQKSTFHLFCLSVSL